MSHDKNTRPPSPASDTVQQSPYRSGKKPASSLLPAFEPYSSSPQLPRPPKRSHDAFQERVTYPTPVPTSSTIVPSSSPQRFPTTRPALQRTQSTLSERTPLSSVPTIQLDPQGKIVRMGRSSVSCDYQLSANRLISRVHVEAWYKSSVSRLERDRLEIKCTGWNGVKIHCNGKVFDLNKDQVFTSDARGVEVMVDVHDSRVLLQWPPKPQLGPISSDEEEEEHSPTAKRQRSMIRHSTPPSPSPVQTRRRLASPISPSPAVQALLPSSPPMPITIPLNDTVDIYEDPAPDSDVAHETPATQATQASTQVLTQPNPSVLTESQDSLLSSANDFSDNDEENDPIVHSFGPFGANLLPRMASFTHGDSPRIGTSTKSSRSSHAMPLQPTVSPSQPTSQSTDFDVKGHIINQLAFSRLSSTPLSTILSHLPREAGVFSKEDLKMIIPEAGCVGEISREGKDAAGKALESEYYYIPDLDEDEKRKEAVVGMKPTLRSVRKQHKVRHGRTAHRYSTDCF